MSPPETPWTAGSKPSAFTRRTVLQSAAAATGVGVAGVGLGQQSEPVPIRLGGVTSGWTVPEDAGDPVGEGPNPTLTLQPGTDYEITWENVDGAAHNVAILDGNDDPLLSSDIISQQGATQTVAFTATEEMAAYICEVHPVSMRGDIEIGGETGEQTENGDTETAGFFEQGAEVGLQQVAAGMTAPTDFDAPPDDDYVYVADQTGELWMVDPEEGRLDEPFIDVSDRMVTLGEFAGEYANPESQYEERGLLGVEFHPDYQENGRLFLHYSAPPNEQTPDRWSHVEVVSEFQASDDGMSADPASEQVLLQFQKPQYNHDAGPIAFGPDGYLYVPMGDGGGANDNMLGHVDDWYDRNSGGNGQDVEQNLLGDVHRIDVDAEGDGDRPYGIPEDNPFAGDDNPGQDEIYAYGFRNPFGISFDSQGNLFVADAGQNLFEEANIVERGGNYGWNVKEGTHCFSTENPADASAITDCPDTEPNEAPYDGSEFQDPIVEYPHTYQGENVGIVIIGGHRYENDAIADLQGKYVFGEWTRDPARDAPLGRVLTATPPDDFGSDSQNGITPTETASATETAQDGADQVVPRDELWEMRELQFSNTEDGSLNRFVRMFGQDDQGNVYVLANTEGVPEGTTGEVLQIVPAGEGDDLAAPDSPPEETPVDSGQEGDNATQGGNATQSGNATDGS